MNRVILTVAAAALLVLGVASGHAAPPVPYNQDSMVAAQAAGKPLVIAVHASWCPVCAKQAPIIRRLSETPEYKDLVILIVDFDSQKDVVQALNVQKQSTLIAMHGKVEKDRSTGVTDEAQIIALLRAAKG